MSQSTGSVPPDTDLIAMTDPASNVGVFYTVAELRAAMSPVGYSTPADEVLTAAVQAAQATANAAIPSATLGQPLGPVQADANNKVPLANLPASVLGSSHFLGTWNALLNVPLIQSGVAPAVSAPVGGYYIVSVAGSPLIDGNSVWNAGDWIIWNGSIWSDIAGQSNPVSSVAGLQGMVTTAQLASALAGSTALNAAGGQLNVVLGTAANTAAAGNDSRIANAAQTSNVNTFLTNVAAIAAYTGNAPCIRTAGYYTAGDGGGAFYTQTDTGAPAIADGAGRHWYLQDAAAAEVNILQFGAKPDGVSDMQPGWAAADAYAAANGKTVFVPSAPPGGSWRLITPMVTTARHLRFEAPYSPGLGTGTLVHFAPAIANDLVAAITLTGNGVLAENVSVSGPSVMPSLANLMSSGWVIAAASFQGTISGAGTTMTIGSGLTGTPAVGQQVSGAGMTSVATITAISGSTLTISPVQPDISVSQTFTACALPNYSAFKAGPVGIAVAAQAVLRSCTTANLKVGILLNNTGGHCAFYDCNAGGFFGYYILDNSYDFVWIAGGASGVWAGFAFGTTNFIGSTGGLQGTFFRVQMPLQAAYHIYQFQDAAFSGGSNGLQGSFYGCSFESCNEAAIQTLATSSSGINLVSCTQQWGGTPLPNTITPAPQQNLFSLGSLSQFTATPNLANTATGTWPASGLGAGAYPQYALTAVLTPHANTDIDLRSLDNNLNIAQGSGFNRWFRNYRSIEDAQKGDFGVRRDLAVSANLIVNPEQNTGGNGLSTAGGNWAVSGSTVTIGAFSTFSELAAIALPQAVQEVLGTNPVVIKIVQSGSNNTAVLSAAANTPAVGVSVPLWLRFWQLQLTSPQQIGYRLVAHSGDFIYNGTMTPAAGVITEILGVNQNLGSAGDTSGIFANLSIFLNSVTTVYFLGVMVGLGEIGPYNPLSTAYAANGLALGDGSATDAQTAVHIITGNGAPTSTAQPAGTLYLRKDGTSTGLYQYLNGAWVAYS
jgi:hypothetical protein